MNIYVIEGSRTKYGESEVFGYYTDPALAHREVDTLQAKGYQVEVEYRMITQTAQYHPAQPVAIPGHVYTLEQYPEPYLLAQVGYDEWAMISLNGGNRYLDPAKTMEAALVGTEEDGSWVHQGTVRDWFGRN